MAKQLETHDKCKLCNKISGCDLWLSCEICDGWFHTSCVKVSDEAYKVLHELDTCHWFCHSCNVKMGKVIPNIVKLNDKITEMEKDLKALGGRNTKMEARQEACEQDLKTVAARVEALGKEMAKANARYSELDVSLQKTVEKQNINFRDIMKEQLEQEMVNVGETVKKEVSVSLGKVTDNIQQVQTDIQETRAQAMEQRDKEARRNNIIMYKVPESNADRTDERNKQDMAFCLNVFNSCMQLGVVEEDLVNVFRLGKRAESGAPRPLMVQLVSYSLKNIIMESLYKLRNAEQKYRGIVIAHDMTKLERDQCKEAVADAKSMAAQDSSGEYVYRVRGPPGEMKVLKFRKRQ